MKAETTKDLSARRKGLSNAKKLAFGSALFVFIMVASEMLGQIAYAIRYKKPFWKESTENRGRPAEQFNIRTFTEIVPDARGVTMKANYLDTNYGPWEISTDSHRFRRGTHVTDSNGNNVIFIGDSVPFGWGVADKASLPSKVSERLGQTGRTEGVINAAIPSYALRQAVARYELEILGKIRAKIVYIQIYDPVSQLVLLGPSWQPDANWTTYSRIQKPPKKHLPGAQWSALIAIFDRAIQRMASPAAADFGEVSVDQMTAQRFQADIQTQLAKLYSLTVEKGVERLIVAPLVAPKSSRETFSPPRRQAVDLLNTELQRFAQSKPKVIFADLTKVLDKYPEEEVFIDKCCHLSEHGNEVVADYLMPLL